jgi:hypothetical protein
VHKSISVVLLTSPHVSHTRRRARVKAPPQPPAPLEGSSAWAARGAKGSQRGASETAHTRTSADPSARYLVPVEKAKRSGIKRKETQRVGKCEFEIKKSE